MKSDKDKLACGLRFMRAISNDTLNNFIIKVRMAVDPYECRRFMTGVEFPAEERQHDKAS